MTSTCRILLTLPRNMWVHTYWLKMICNRISTSKFLLTAQLEKSTPFFRNYVSYKFQSLSWISSVVSREETHTTNVQQISWLMWLYSSQMIIQLYEQDSLDNRLPCVITGLCYDAQLRRFRLAVVPPFVSHYLLLLPVSWLPTQADLSPDIKSCFKIRENIPVC